MPRRGNVPKREVLPDPVYGSELVTRLVNNIMLDGKKGVAQKIVYGAFEIVAEKTGKDALEAFEEAMEHIMPQDSTPRSFPFLISIPPGTFLPSWPPDTRPPSKTTTTFCPDSPGFTLGAPVTI